jgi:deoxyribonuclease IV
MLYTMTSYPLIGAQTSTAGGFGPVAERAHLLGAEVVQVFSSNPRQWPTRPPSHSTLMELVEGLQRYRLPLFLHTIYLINLATPDEALRRRSIEALASALALGALTGAAGVVTHIGSHRGDGAARGCARAVDGVRAAADLAAQPLGHGHGGYALPPLLLETGVGAGNTLGGSLEEVAGILADLPTRGTGATFGLCIDTAHLFASGYPLHHAEGLEQVIGELSDLGLLPRLGLVHLNDSASSFASRHDLHENPGAGQIGYDGLAGVVRHRAFAGVPFVLETPGLEGHGPDAANLAVVKAMRAGLPAAAALAAAKDAHQEQPSRGG